PAYFFFSSRITKSDGVLCVKNENSKLFQRKGNRQPFQIPHRNPFASAPSCFGILRIGARLFYDRIRLKRRSTSALRGNAFPTNLAFADRCGLCTVSSVWGCDDAFVNCPIFLIALDDSSSEPPHAKPSKRSEMKKVVLVRNLKQAS